MKVRTVTIKPQIAKDAEAMMKRLQKETGSGCVAIDIETLAYSNGDVETRYKLYDVSLREEDQFMTFGDWTALVAEVRRRIYGSDFKPSKASREREAGYSQD